MAKTAASKKFRAPSIETVPQGVPDGMVVDFLTGRFFRDTPEEYVRQNIEKAVVRQYRCGPADAAPEFPIKVGVARKRVDVSIFKPGVEHIQQNAWLLIETKSADTKPSNAKEGVAQLQSYMAACVNCEYGLWTNGDDRFCYAKRKDGNEAPILQKSQPPEILFIERCLQFLREGTGRMAMVLPNGILNNPALGYVRQWILRNAQVIAVVDMARELFQPKNDTQTSMVLLRRLSEKERASAAKRRLDYPVFMAVTEFRVPGTVY